MAQAVELVSEYEGLAGALFSFDILRAELAEQSAGSWRLCRARDEVVSARELAMLAELNGIHDAMSEIDQLRLYRFYLTAVHRNSLSSHRFDAQIVAFPERAAAIERELEEVGAELHTLIAETGAHSALTHPKEAFIQAGSFLWTMSWWLHARPDATDFEFPNGDDALTALLLGRPPASDEPICDQMYRCAIKAEHEYRNMLMQRAPHIPLHLRSEAHM